MNVKTYKSCGSVIKGFKMEQKYQLMEPVYVDIDRRVNILSYVDFQVYAM